MNNDIRIIYLHYLGRSISDVTCYCLEIGEVLHNRCIKECIHIDKVCCKSSVFSQKVR
jgi:hypothetical protein